MLLANCAVFKVRREAPDAANEAALGLSKLNSMRARRPLPDWSTFRDAGLERARAGEPSQTESEQTEFRV